MKKARFKEGDILWATAVKTLPMSSPVEVVIATKAKKKLCNVLDWMSCNCVAGEFKQIELRKSRKRKGKE